MPPHEFFWTERAIEKIGDNGLTVEEVEYAVRHAEKRRRSHTGRPAYVGVTPGGDRIFVPFEFVDELVIAVVTAF